MTLKIEVGKTYIDASGRQVRVVAIRKTANKTYAPFIGLVLESAIDSKDTELSAYFWETGVSPYSEGKRNIMKEYKGPEYRWFTIYGGPYKNNETVGYWSCKEDLFKALQGHPAKPHLIAIVKIDINTGVVENEELPK